MKGADKRFISGHQNIGRYEQRGPSKLTRYEVDEATGCWNWLLTVNKKYGTESVYGEGTKGAHVMAYERAKGKVPKGLEIDHLCRNTLCVNPDHLEAVTRKVNNRRKPTTKLSVEKVTEIWDRLNAGGVSKAQLGREYGVDRSTISCIYIGKNWKEVARIPSDPSCLDNPESVVIRSHFELWKQI